MFKLREILELLERPCVIEQLRDVSVTISARDLNLLLFTSLRVTNNDSYVSSVFWVVQKKNISALE